MNLTTPRRAADGSSPWSARHSQAGSRGSSSREGALGFLVCSGFATALLCGGILIGYQLAQLATSSADVSAFARFASWITNNADSVQAVATIGAMGTSIFALIYLRGALREARLATFTQNRPWLKPSLKVTDVKLEQGHIKVEYQGRAKNIGRSPAMQVQLFSQIRFLPHDVSRFVIDRKELADFLKSQTLVSYVMDEVVFPKDGIGEISSYFLNMQGLRGTKSGSLVYIRVFFVVLYRCDLTSELLRAGISYTSGPLTYQEGEKGGRLVAGRFKDDMKFSRQDVLAT